MFDALIPLRRTVMVLVVLLTLAMTSPAHAADVETMARELAALRSEVESLSSELELRKQELRSQLRSLSEQKADLELELRKEQLRLEQVRQAQNEQRDVISRARDAGRELQPVVEQNIDDLQRRIDAGLPFKVAERSAELDKLRGQIEKGLLTAPQAASRLWSFMEDELRLSRENGLYRQVIVLDGAEELAQVARIGLVMLFFKTEDGRVGYAERTGDDWRFVEIDEREGRRQVDLLFESFTKRIRTGYFEIPNALPRGGDDR